MDNCECQVCRKRVKRPQRIDVPENATLCSSCFSRFVTECDRCHQMIASQIVEGGQLLDEAPIFGEVWCLRCCADHTAVCESCGANHLIEHLKSVPEGLLCELCLRRHERISSGCAIPLTLANWEEVISAAIRILPERLRDAVECQLGDGEQLILVKNRTTGSVGHGDEQVAQITVRLASLSPSIPWPEDPKFPPGSEQMLEKRAEWSAAVILGSTIGVTILHVEGSFNVDLEQAIQGAILGEMFNLGLVSRDRSGRFVDEDNDQIWP